MSSSGLVDVATDRGAEASPGCRIAPRRCRWRVVGSCHDDGRALPLRARCPPGRPRRRRAAAPGRPRRARGRPLRRPHLRRLPARHDLRGGGGRARGAHAARGRGGRRAARRLRARRLLARLRHGGARRDAAHCLRRPHGRRRHPGVGLRRRRPVAGGRAGPDALDPRRPLARAGGARPDGPRRRGGRRHHRGVRLPRLRPPVHRPDAARRVRPGRHRDVLEPRPAVRPGLRPVTQALLGD